MAATRLYPGSDGPIRNAESGPFWEAAGQGRFVLPYSVETGQAHWYPRAFCPFTYGEVEWHEASGEGVVYSFTIVGKGEESYALAYVTLAEGPTMLTNILADDSSSLRIGAKVELVFQPAQNGEALPVFKPT